MAKYMKKVEVEAIQYTDLSAKSIRELKDFCGDKITIDHGVVTIQLPYLNLDVPVGCYIIKSDILGFELCDEAVFKRIYELVEE